MGYSTTHGRSCKLTIPSAWFSSSLTDFPVLFTTANLPSEMFDADGSYPAKSDGSDVRFSTDSAGNTPLNVQIVTFSIDNTPANGTAEIWVKVPSLSNSVATDVYVWYNDPDASAVAADSATEGSEGVWDSDFAGVYHLQEAVNTGAGGYEDSTANAYHATGSGMNEAATADKWGSGGLGQNFDATDSVIALPAGVAATSIQTLTLTAWIQADAKANYVGLFNEVAGIGLIMSGASGNPLGYIWQGNSDEYNAASGLTIATDGTYQQVALRVNSAAAILYVDTSTWTNTKLHPEKSLATFQIGKDRSFAARIFDGFIGEARITFADRGNAWVIAEYNTGNAPTDVTVGTPSSPASGSILPILLQMAA